MLDILAYVLLFRNRVAIDLFCFDSTQVLVIFNCLTYRSGVRID